MRFSLVVSRCRVAKRAAGIVPTALTRIRFICSLNRWFTTAKNIKTTIKNKNRRIYRFFRLMRKSSSASYGALIASLVKTNVSCGRSFHYMRLTIVRKGKEERQDRIRRIHRSLCEYRCRRTESSPDGRSPKPHKKATDRFLGLLQFPIGYSGESLPTVVFRLPDYFLASTG